MASLIIAFIAAHMFMDGKWYYGAILGYYALVIHATGCGIWV